MASRMSGFLVFGLFLTGAAAFAQEDRSVVNAYLTAEAPTIDGVIEPGEWDAAGPPIVVTSESPGARFANHIEEDPYGGDADLSFQVRIMWMGDWFLYFLYEVTDDIAMAEDPTNLWERDQIEHFMDGNELEGNDDGASFHWWDNDEIYGKFGVSRYGDFEGNGGVMSANQDDLIGTFVGEGNFIACAAVAAETGENANYIVEYAITLEPLWFFAVIDDPVTEGFTMKYTVALSDDDNFTGALDDGSLTERSSDLALYRANAAGDDPGWDVSSAYSTLTLAGAFVHVEDWSVY